MQLTKGTLSSIRVDTAAVPLSIDQHRANAEFEGAIWAFVEIDTSKFEGFAEKIDITIPRGILAKVDDYAKTHGLTRSGFLVQAAMRAIR